MTAYLRRPTVAGDLVVAVADDDLWALPLAGGAARRLTANRGPVGHPCLTPDGTRLGFTGTEEHHPEAYVMPAGGGPAERVTWLGGTATAAAGWTPGGDLLVTSNAGCAFARDSALHRVDPDSARVCPCGWGTVHEAAFAADGAVLLGRNTTNQGRWKRYRGGTVGQLWLDPSGDGVFHRLLADLGGDVGSPLLAAGRVWFLADHEGVGNLYSCDRDGGDLRRHTDHHDFYARHAATDGHTIVYTVGGTIWAYDLRADRTRPLDVRLSSPRVQRNRRFIDAARYLQGYDVHPAGTHVALRVRGNPYTMPLFDGPVRQHGPRAGVGHRLVRWLDDQRLVLVGDSGGEERLEVHDVAAGAVRRFDDLDLGVLLELEPAPTGDRVALTSQRGELRVVDLEDGTATAVAASPYGIDHPAWSPDGRWLAFSARTSNWYTAAVRLWSVEGGEPVAVTDGTASDRAPAFDPAGRYLYLVSSRRFDPVADGVYFDHGFPFPDAVLAAVLRADAASPLLPPPRPPGDDGGGRGRRKPRQDQDPPAVQVDTDGLADRLVVLPFPTGRYHRVAGLKDKVLALGSPLRPEPLEEVGERPPTGQVEMLDLASLRHEVLVTGVSSFRVSRDAATLVYASRRRLRALKAGAKPPEGADAPPRVSGWLDLGRVRPSVDPPAEWRQVLVEAWRLQRELFWVEDMAGVDWPAVLDRYLGLLDRISTREELSDLIWEMFGELGTGHAYERGGDRRTPPRTPLGHLGADLRFDPEADAGWWTGCWPATSPPTPRCARRWRSRVWGFGRGHASPPWTAWPWTPRRPRPACWCTAPACG